MREVGELRVSSERIHSRNAKLHHLTICFFTQSFKTLNCTLPLKVHEMASSRTVFKSDVQSAPKSDAQNVCTLV